MNFFAVVRELNRRELRKSTPPLRVLGRHIEGCRAPARRQTFLMRRGGVIKCRTCGAVARVQFLEDGRVAMPDPNGFTIEKIKGGWAYFDPVHVVSGDSDIAEVCVLWAEAIDETEKVILREGNHTDRYLWPHFRSYLEQWEKPDLISISARAQVPPLTVQRSWRRVKATLYAIWKG